MRAIAVILLISCCFVAAEAAPLAEKVPAKTLAYAGWAGRGLVFDGSMLGQMLKEPEIRQTIAFIRDFFQQHPSVAQQGEAFDCLWALAEIAWQRPMAIALMDVKLQEGAPQCVAALLIDLGDERETFAEQLDKAIQAAAERLNVTESTVGTTTYKTLSGPGGVQISFGYVDSMFFACVGDDLPAGLIGLAPAKSLAANEAFTTSLSKVSGEDEQIVFYADIKGLLDRAEKLTPPAGTQPAGAGEVAVSQLRRTADALGFGKATVLAGVVRIVERGLYTKIKLFSPAPHTGVLMLLGGGALTEADLTDVPDDAVFVAAIKLSPGAVLSELQAAMGQIAPPVKEKLDKALSDFDKQLGLSLQEDILAALGDTWVLSSAPSQGGFLTGTLLAVDVKDSEKLSASVTKIEAVLAGELATTLPASVPAETQPAVQASQQSGPRILTAKAGRAEVHYLNFEGDRQPVPIRPAWAIYKDRFYLGLWPQVIQSAIENAGKNELTKDAEFVRIRSKLSQNPSAIVYINHPKILRTIYPIQLLIGSVVPQVLARHQTPPEAPLWPMALWKLEKYAWPQVIAASAEADGITIESYGSGMLTAGPMLSASVLVPALPRARSNAARAASTANLHGIGKCIVLYRGLYEDRPPPDLAALLEENMISTTRMFVSPVSGREPPRYEDGKLIGEMDYVYMPLPANAPGDLIMVYERPENYRGKNTNVLYADGRVEWVDKNTFEARLRRTQDWVKENPVKATKPIKQDEGF